MSKLKKLLVPVCNEIISDTLMGNIRQIGSKNTSVFIIMYRVFSSLYHEISSNTSCLLMHTYSG
jgi:hypothetical protein